MKKTISGKRKICFPHVQVDGRASEGESANLDHLCHRERFTIDLLCKQLLLYNKTISDGGITVDFSIIKVHTSN